MNYIVPLVLAVNLVCPDPSFDKKVKWDASDRSKSTVEYLHKLCRASAMGLCAGSVWKFEDGTIGSDCSGKPVEK